ncbi:hypothetical protein NW762_011042 [Fusarium torreyae]|uniref:Xylanolytic transcriptional activator regulatory domain-containing protein n=1 Tax=Fusarium torreyae TaxID=1237075 RepID=A0A9W8VCZ5_9HYPO|nr:hypothetical protein NW762_011042 [Fusarium torreyae]
MAMDVDNVESDMDDNGGPATRRIPEHKLSIKCDRVDPCGPCIRKQIRCSYPAGFKPRAKRQRTLVSNDYETKLDAISQKLDRISLAVDNINTSPPQLQGSSSAVHTAISSHVTPKSHTDSPAYSVRANDDAGSELEGDVTLTTQATFATDFLQQVVDSNQISHALPEIKTSLDALRRTLATRNIDGEEPRLVDTQQVLSPTNQGSFQLPPIHLAMLAIQRLRDTPRLKLFWCVEFQSISQFVEYIMTVYFGKPTLADLIITNGGLQGILLEYGNMETDEALKSEFRSQGMLCRQNLEIILASLPFNLPPTLDYILALFMASTYCLDKCRISMSWNFIAAAAQMCQTIGFTRDALTKPETPEAKQRRAKLVWCIHMLDKLLSLRLSRPSLIRDGEITLRFEMFEADVGDGIGSVIAKWAHMCDLQGRVYDFLYSPRALAQPDGQREAHARDLATQMQTLFHTKSLAEDRLSELGRKSLGYELGGIFQKADKIGYLSTLCLIYRAIKPASSTHSAFCDECLAVAKEAIEEHKTCLVILKDAETSIFEFYVQWALMAVPLVPFIVLFCHAIETCDPTHLESLASVVETVDILPDDLPDVYRKQLRLFKLMYDVACKYVSSKARNPPMQASGRIPDTPYEMLFIEAGIPYPTQIHAHTGMQDFQVNAEQGTDLAFGDFGVGAGQGELMVEGNNINHGMELGNWFEQNQEIFKMLDNDL